MLASYARSARVSSRKLVTSSRLLSVKNPAAKSFSSPQELVEKRKVKELEDQRFTESLLNKDIDFEPKLIKPNEVDPFTKRPVPLNVELLKYKPLKLEPTHGHKVAEINFSGYDETEVLRMAEFTARAAFYLGIPASDIEKVKTEKKLYTVIRSPFAQAKSKENFFRTTFKRRLVAFDANPEIVDLWLSYTSKYALESVHRKALVFTHESLDYAETMSKLTAEEMELPRAYQDNMEDPVGKKVQELLSSDAFKESMKEGK
ncbi:mitochondrial ribosomal protein S10 [Metschnikowia bicuspidata var. bicuspidata NRRL YB-4993]|uniref:Mitochondrial ribosomal protein S10 n=1 Tax=Metschnikowia bicuspidata var. bicuspidata NRRL YB-4993 TaxID=869754 RepID=A0A1A0HCX9_9ASCO|nr:mitochondrial ribosomal protein S10 [Metschnikowia bicuspidata var. bicuspidata NRRL YB-4993]OBA21737.1 mitochondrial ribosomal protein S10 [Metschnikowia bicuspidata var. bicuspidata NRRL YB-4993]